MSSLSRIMIQVLVLSNRVFWKKREFAHPDVLGTNTSHPKDFFLMKRTRKDLEKQRYLIILQTNIL